ncbi:hypothetical protein J3R83DRAFT_4376, partial [Lanmaoa asiatica]
MTDKAICPYCFDTFDQQGTIRLERHVKSKHNEEQQLHLYSFGQSWVIREKKGRFKCPLCEFSGLPWDLLVHHEEMHL